MKKYELHTEFTFGKYEGETLESVLISDPGYIEWCAQNLDHFYLDGNALESMKEVNPEFSLSEKSQKALEVKYDVWREREPSDPYYGFDSASDLAFHVAFDGDVDAWNHFNE